jgi:hypothetical protein
MVFNDLSGAKKEYKEILMKLMYNAKNLLYFIEKTNKYTPTVHTHYINFYEEMKKEWRPSRDYSFWRDNTKQRKEVK